MCKQVRRIAETVKIDLAFVPSGCTDELQRCDRCVFGEFKAICDHLYGRAVDGHCSKARAVSMLVWSWTALRCPHPPPAKLGGISRHEGIDGGGGGGSLI
jgi:hypothetical protein